MPEKQYSTVTQVVMWDGPTDVIVDSSTEILTEDPTALEALNELGENGWKLVSSNTFAFFSPSTPETSVGQQVSVIMERDSEEFAQNGGDATNALASLKGHTWR